MCLAGCGGQNAQSEGAATPPELATEKVPVETSAASDGPVQVDAAPVDEQIRMALDASDRDVADRDLDAQRRPAELLSFLGIRPGMKVADLAAGGGYTTEALARAVGPSGKVYGQNSAFILERFAETPWSTRLKKPVMGNVERINSEFDAPLPNIKDLDAVVMVLFYHDTVWLKTDRAAMNKAIYAALKPGGVYGIVDHEARAGDGVKEASTLHRIEQGVVKSEVEAAGFELAAEGTFLRNPSDTKDWNASPMKAAERRGTSDRFVLKFVKP